MTDARVAERRSEPGGPTWWSTSIGRAVATWGVILGMVAVSIPLHLAATSLAPLPGAFAVPWWAIALAMLVTELAVIHAQVDEDAHSFTLNELPLVLGLAFAGPAALVIGRVLGVAGALGIQGPRTPVKAAFNLSLAHLEVTGAILLYRMVLGSSSPASLDGGIAAVVVALVTQFVGLLAVTGMIALHTGSRPGRLLAATFAPTMVTHVGLASLAAVAVFVISVDPGAWILLVVVSLLVLVAFRAYRRLRHRHDDLESVYAFTRALGGAEYDRDPNSTVLRTVLDVLRCDIAELHLDGAGPSGRRYDRAVGGPLGAPPLDPAVPAGLERFCGEDGAAFDVDVIRETEPDIAAALSEAGYRCVLAVAIENGGEPIGTLVVGNRNGPEPYFTRDDARLMGALAQQISVAVQRNDLVGRLRHDATHDALTQLPNRASFLRYVDASVAADAAPRGTAVLLLDLDRFKEINDTLGHAAGDRLLCDVSDRLRTLVGADTFVGRLGGDEFVIVLRDTDLVAAVDVGESVVTGLGAPFVCDGVSVEVGTSIGVSLAPHHGSDSTTLLQRADVAMYAAKRAGCGLTIYDASIDEHSVRSLALAAHLRDAIEGGEIDVHFQPQVLASDGRVVSVEALARWVHPRFGPIPPSEFIPLAERTGSIRPLTVSILRTAVETALALDPDGRLAVAVNISPRVLADADLPETVGALLRETGLAPSRLVLEITESSLVAEGGRIPTILDALTELGVRLSIDDFGTGYSSLSYLPRIPAHELKIDRSFVMRMLSSDPDAAIVQTTIELAARLGLTVVAEGVESEEEWDQLRRMGCDLLQGYHISRPLPAAALASFLRPVRAVRDDPGTAAVA